jgi:hypothetical protein
MHVLESWVDPHYFDEGIGSQLKDEMTKRLPLEGKIVFYTTHSMNPLLHMFGLDYDREQLFMQKHAIERAARQQDVHIYLIHPQKRQELAKL